MPVPCQGYRCALHFIFAFVHPREYISKEVNIDVNDGVEEGISENVNDDVKNRHSSRELRTISGRFAMKKWLVVLLIVTVTAGALFAGSPGRSEMKDHHPVWAAEEQLLEQQLEAVLAAKENSVLGELTVGEAQDLLGEISIAYQKAAYVSKSRRASMMLPGLGQFMNDDPGMGALFLSLDLATGVGMLLGAYFLLPAELQFDQLNYFTEPYIAIETAWEGQSFVDLLPSLGVLAGGGVVLAILRGLSGDHATRLAEQRIAAGEITFEPKLSILPAGYGAMGFGMGMHY